MLADVGIDHLDLPVRHLGDDVGVPEIGITEGVPVILQEADDRCQMLHRVPFGIDEPAVDNQGNPAVFDKVMRDEKAVPEKDGRDQAGRAAPQGQESPLHCPSHTASSGTK